MHDEFPRTQGMTSFALLFMVQSITYCAIKDYVLSVAVSHDGQWVVSGSKDRGVQFWDSRSAIVQFMLQGHKNSGNFFFFDSLPWTHWVNSHFHRSEPIRKLACYRKRRLGCPNMCVYHFYTWSCVLTNGCTRELQHCLILFFSSRL